MKMLCECGKEINPSQIRLRHDGGCNDPECCGGRSYYGIVIECSCGKREEIDCKDED